MVTDAVYYFKKARSRALLLLIGLVCVLLLKAEGNDRNASVPMTFGPEVYTERRLALLDSLGDGMAIIYSRGDWGEMGYRADGDFWYLTGLDDPGAILLLAPREKHRAVLFLAPRDPEEERWLGERASLTDSLKTALQVDDINRTSELDWWLTSRIGHLPVLHMISRPVGPGSEIPPDMALYSKICDRIPGVTTKNSSKFLEAMRMRKSPSEIAAIEKAIEVTYQGLIESLPLIRPGVSEFQLAAKLQESCKQQGAQFASFAPIVGAGRHSTVLHYGRLDKEIKPGELVLIDFGAEWNHYAADITRTFPVDGKFTEAQAQIYDVVLEAQKAAIEAIKPGITPDSVHAIARGVIQRAGYVDAFIHGTSHYLGIETHDVGDYWQPLEPGMVITVEPGVYLPESGIGIRIEDDVLVTENGHRVLSNQIPKERTEIEQWMALTDH
ncbi:MAG: Xaa-Pro peptidase family protein [Candidatus Zixiibacteriota bacterium]